MNLNCVICAELFSSSDDVYVTTCGHIFHYVCLKQWLERSKTCPQCRHRCHDKHIHRIYFNIANIDVSRIDVGSLQQQLEDAEFKNKLKDKELEKAQDEIKELKETQKKTRKTITALEKKVEQKNSLILSFNEQMNILKSENQIVDDLKKVVKELKNKIELMGSVESVITSTASDVEKMLKEDNNPKTLSVWVATLKRELRVCESKKVDLRNSLKIAQHDLRKEREQKGSLEEKIVQLESENYRLNEIVKTLDQQKENPAKNSDDLMQSPVCPVPTKKFRLLDSTNMPSPSLSEKVKKIEESDSPYFNIKQSGVGLAPLLNLAPRKKIEESRNQPVSVQNSSGELTEYSIFKKPRLLVQSTKVQNSQLAFNGVGGSERKDSFTFSVRSRERKEKPKSISDRLKNGKLRKIASTSDIEKFLS